MAVCGECEYQAKKCQMTWSIKMNNHENINIDEITNEEEENK